jgi:hypothetical protein
MRQGRPADGESFKLEELQTLVGGYIELARTRNGQPMFVDEEGKLKGKPHNQVATALYLHGDHDPIVGDAVLGTPKEMGEDASDGHTGF